MQQVTINGIVEALTAELMRRGHRPDSDLAVVDGIPTRFRVDLWAKPPVVHVGPRAVHQSFLWSGTVANVLRVVDAVLAVVRFAAEVREAERPIEPPDVDMQLEADGSYTVMVRGLGESQARALMTQAGCSKTGRPMRRQRQR
jgi:hypothetical protein